jgi:hypothetical protein
VTSARDRAQARETHWRHGLELRERSLGESYAERHAGRLAGTPVTQKGYALIGSGSEAGIFAVLCAFEGHEAGRSS